ncbi:structure-specific endonuclease subunit SLX4 [Vanessa cardui]|uniref:structure-specific endonuclease subunit SLX4 n=1 Tax=Vanessa cardui TaxID=171605 RepID=UPI001F12D637|nr:structure-specific endonuclease subunit SLX4 [Vanessa cardui]
MNINKNSSECLVVSEYFTTKTVMDNSLSDFQEKKKCNTGPKNVQKNKVSKQNKKLKKVKGQRDIRSLVKNKDSELVSYSKNFDQVCKKSGIDVDSEQLQLAIALSKSLYETETKTCSENQESKPLSLTAKTLRIRTTLQEYGFRVPNTKINKESRKYKQFKKQYKLLLLSDEEKRQNISDRYAEVLATNIHRSPSKLNTFSSNNNQELFYKASNISYEFLRNDETFYVKDLFEKPLCKSHLLRDWAEIPGRPASPTREVSNFNFDNIECTQDDLDCILSGSVQAVQDIIKNKYLSNNSCSMDTNDRDMSCTNNDLDDLKCVNNLEVAVFSNETLVSQVRSGSPDIFDDDISLIADNDAKSTQLVQQSMKKVDNNIDFMDLTECVTHAPESSSILKYSQRQINETKRKSNDLMEITECVPNDIQYPIENIDLTHSCSNSNRESHVNKLKEQHLEMDLTQSNHDNLSPIKVFGNNDENSLDNTVLINESFKVVSNETPNNDKLNLEMTPKADIIESYSCVSKVNDENVPNCSLTNSFHENEDNFSHLSQLNIVNSSTKPDNLEIDLTQSTHSDDDFQLSQNVRTKKDHSLDGTVVIIDDAEFDLNPVCSNETSPIQINPVSVNDLNRSKVDFKYEDSTKNHSESELTKHKNTDDLFSEFYGDLTSNKDSCNIKKIEKIDLTQPFNCDIDQGAEICRIKKKISLENTVPIDVDIESNASTANEDLLLLPKDSENIHNDCSKTDDKNESDINERQDGNNSVSYSFNAPVYNTSHIDDYYNENSLHKDETQEKIPRENTSFRESNHNKSPSYFQLSNCNSYASTSDSHKNSIKNSDKVIEDIIVEDEIDNIDLTQKSDSSNDLENHYHSKPYETNSLGKKDNISIDYDEMFDDVMSTGSKYVSQASDNTADNSNNELLSNPSKTSDCFEISDKEFNYSLQQSRHNFDIGGLSIMDNISESKLQSINKSNNSRSLNRSHSDSDLPSTDVNKLTVYTPKPIKSNSFTSETCTPVINKHLIKEVQQTPGNSEYIIKTMNVTPMLDYESMSSPERNRELEKYGLKPFKRKRAIQLLKHLYNQTHPVVESCDIDECSSPSKKRKYDIGNKLNSPKKSPRKESPRKQLAANFEETNKENTLYATTKESPDLGEIICNPDEWVFQKREKAKVHSCKVPLHIAFHNYVSCRQLLREAILRYEPVNIDVIHKDLVSYGFKYNPKDLLRFMDKKCITVKTTDNNSRNRKS